ncbi:MAG: sugar ABC transporter permease [Cylindrospermopsis raciborskii KL1]|jgi:multiple sugar transport system permease protein|uniref:carbohydrate ABC transporter permease n=1 Tax=Cylindrospermopsis raciborskii TaxID=77022 RepID=UPI001A24BE22|nr:sugar ABC transporter permease [Cylindrospermopsis raciborskii]MBG0744710.1 sugar ABC transporter permease [Cylindrospermopsis raciborskii KL1]
MKQQQKKAWLLLLPALILLMLVFAYPIGRTFWLSFFTENLGTKLRPIYSGLDNYMRMVGDSRFWESLRNTTIFTVVSVLLEVILGLNIALLLNQQILGRNIVRTVAILPWALPTAIIGLIWNWIFNDQFGVVNDLLIKWHWIDSGINWLGEPITAMIAVIVADVWKTTPFISIILLAGLQGIPPDLYEAHEVDGATPWQSFYLITLPLLMPQIIIALLFRLAQAFGIFDLISVMTGGGPGGATEVISLYTYSTVMRYLDFGYGATLVVITFLVLTITVIIFGLLLRNSSQNNPLL